MHTQLPLLFELFGVGFQTWYACSALALGHKLCAAGRLVSPGKVAHIQPRVSQQMQKSMFQKEVLVALVFFGLHLPRLEAMELHVENLDSCPAGSSGYQWIPLSPT